MRPFISLFGLLLFGGGFAQLNAQDHVNADVLAIARSFKDGGSYQWKGSGTPEEIAFKGERILSAGQGTYCSGFTFAVVMRAAEQRGLLKDKGVPQIRTFQKEWYGATESSREKQCQLAVVNLGIGVPVSHDEAQAGDFAQFWREKSGHSVLFLGWVEENGRRIGLRYRSSQPSTDGIGDRAEYFETIRGQKEPVSRERLYFCRLNAARAN